MIKISMPLPWRSITKNQAKVFAEGKNLKELIENLEKKYPGIKEKICEPSVNLFLNGNNLLKKTKVHLKEGDEISIILTIAGG